MSGNKIYPTISDLLSSEPHNCPQCPATSFKSESNLRLHLAKTHGQAHLMAPRPVSTYLCPVSTCRYHKEEHFKRLKALKQHYVKTHQERTWWCAECKKTFPTEQIRNRHAEYCRVMFRCSDCTQEYPCYETLKTHCRRKKHSIRQKTAFRTNVTRHLSLVTVTQRAKHRAILPRIAALPLRMDSSSQTEDMNTTTTAVETQTGGQSFLRESSSTQTLPSTEIYSIHTDTSDLFFDPNFFNCHMETQTDCFEESLFEDYSNMCTQTTDVFEEMLKSVEIQTTLSQSKRPEVGTIETQTETVEWTKMLDEINA